MDKNVTRARISAYGWVIVATAVICLLLIYGIRHSFSAFFPSILAEFGWTRGNTALIFALSVLNYGLIAPIAGNLADRWKPKLMIFFGVLLIGISSASCALANELWQFYLLFGVLMPLGAAFSGAPIFVPAIANWFVSKGGMAVGIGLAGGGLSFSMAAYAEFLISIYGWRLAFVIMSGSVVGIVVPLVLLFFRYRPKEQRQLNPDTPKKSRKENENVTEVIGAGNSYGYLPLKRILQNHRLWLLVFTYMLYMGIANFLIIGHQIIYFVDLGYSSRFAASIAGLVGIFIAVGTLSGFLADWMGREKALTLATILSISALLILLSQNDASNPWALYIFSFCFGFPGGLFAPSIVSGAADLFYGKHFGVVNGLLLMGFGIGGAIGPWMGGYIFDITGSYFIAFIICISAFCLACASFWIAAPRKAKVRV